MAKHKNRHDKGRLPKSGRNAEYKTYLQRRGGKNTMSNTDRTKMAGERALVRQNLNAEPRIIFNPTVRRPNVANVNRQTYRNFSDCALFYAQAVIDPWGVTVPPCIPDFYTVPSFKFGTRTRGTMFVGTLNFGYIIFDPYVPSSDRNNTAFTTGLFTGAEIGTPGESNTDTMTNNSPFVSNQFASDGLEYRLVGAGMACRYLGNEMSRGGQMIIYRNPSNGSYPVPTTQQLMLSNPETTTVPVDREWHYVTFKPVESSDYEYSFTVVNNFNMIIAVTGIVNGAAFEFDCVQWFEIIGQPVPQVTPSDSDPIGMAVIKSAFAVPQPPDSPKENFGRFMKSAMSIANDTLSFIGTGAKAFGKGVAMLNNIGLL